MNMDEGGQNFVRPFIVKTEKTYLWVEKDNRLKLLIVVMTKPRYLHKRTNGVALIILGGGRHIPPDGRQGVFWFRIQKGICFGKKPPWQRWLKKLCAGQRFPTNGYADEVRPSRKESAPSDPEADLLSDVGEKLRQRDFFHRWTEKQSDRPGGSVRERRNCKAPVGQQYLQGCSGPGCTAEQLPLPNRRQPPAPDGGKDPGKTRRKV